MSAQTHLIESTFLEKSLIFIIIFGEMKQYICRKTLNKRHYVF